MNACRSVHRSDHRIENHTRSCLFATFSDFAFDEDFCYFAVLFKDLRKRRVYVVNHKHFE